MTWICPAVDESCFEFSTDVFRESISLRFVLIDRIKEVQPGRLIRTEKKLSMAEEYLSDHFPGFPVMPGVLILESMIQSSAWLWRISDDFSLSMIVLKQAKAVRYKGFVSPGQTLSIESECHQQEGNSWTFKCEGFIDGKSCCNSKIVLQGFNLRDRNPALQSQDESLIAHYRSMYPILEQKQLQALT